MDIKDLYTFDMTAKPDTCDTIVWVCGDAEIDGRQANFIRMD
jgi:hypothetical protein